MSGEIGHPKTAKKLSLAKKAIVFFAVAAIVVVAYNQFGDLLRLEKLDGQEVRLRSFQSDNPILVYGAAFLAYVAVTGFSLPGATVLTLVYGW